MNTEKQKQSFTLSLTDLSLESSLNFDCVMEASFQHFVQLIFFCYFLEEHLLFYFQSYYG